MLSADIKPNTSRDLLSIIIPCYNEEKNIRSTVEIAHQHLSKERVPFELVLVNDGSQDDTHKTIYSLKKNEYRVVPVSYSKNKGKGGAVKEGLRSAHGNFFLFMDADLSTSLESIGDFYSVASNYDFVIGSRAHEKSAILQHQPRSRELAGRLGNKIIKTLFLLPYNDTQCGFKLMNHRMRDIILQRSIIDGFAFDVECFVLAKKHNLSICEMPVQWTNRQESRLKTQHFFIFLNELKKISLNKY